MSDEAIAVSNGMAAPAWSEILDFWFAMTTENWFAEDAGLDAVIRESFGGLHRRAGQCELWTWRERPEGRLAEIIILDQFTRNLFRHDRAAFGCDPLALALAQEAVRCRADLAVPARQRAFFYMPFMHSESAAIQAQSLALFEALGDPDNLDYARAHRDVIARFGRFPHRNVLLGRESTPAEAAYLAEGGTGSWSR